MGFPKAAGRPRHHRGHAMTSSASPPAHPQAPTRAETSPTRLHLFCGPEILLLLLTVAVFALCGLHATGSRRDLSWMETMIVALPWIAVPLAYAGTLFVGCRSWFTLARINFALFIALTACTLRIVAGFGTGAHGQDAAILLVFTFGMLLASLGNAITGARILAARQPAFRQWFGSHRVGGSALVALATVPIAVATIAAASIAFGLLGGIWSLLAR